MPRQGWKSVSLPETLIREVDEEIEKNPSFWKSRADFIAYAVRRFLEILRETHQSSRPDVGAAEQIMREVEEMAR